MRFSNHWPKFVLMLLGVCLLLGLSGCAAIERMQLRPTEVYYVANTTEYFPPKPSDFVVPVLNQPPPRSRTIGVFQFKTLKDRAFALKSALYNARRVGADAVWIRSIHEWAEPYAYDVPDHWETRWETRVERHVVRSKGKNGAPDQISEEIINIPVQRQMWVPTQHVSGFNHFTSIDAAMVRLR
jgi:hypothetical protein